MKDYFNVEFSENKQILIKAPNDLSGEYVIPEGVISIAENAFKGCSSLNQITIPRSLKRIEKDSFSDCKALTTVYYNGGIENWLNLEAKSYFPATHRFFYKEDVSFIEATSIVIPESITRIRSYAFYCCRSLQNVVFHNRITSIEESSFNKTSLFGAITLPQELRNLGNLAFLGSKISSVFIPDSVEQIGWGCFGLCPNLKLLKVDKDNSLFMSNEDGNALFDKFQTELIACACGSDSSLVLSKTCQKIRLFALSGSRIDKIYLRNIKTKITLLRNCSSKFYVPAGTKSYYEELGFPKDSIIEECDEKLLFKKGFLSLVENNPFRVLGVFANDTTKTITSNTTRIKRYIEVGKNLSFPSDSLLDSQNARTLSSVDTALSSVNLPKDKAKYAMFWFGRPDMNENPDHFIMTIKRKRWKEFSESYPYNSTIYPNGINWSLTEYIKGNNLNYIFNLINCVKSSEFRKSFLESICGDSELFDKESFIHLILDELLKECEHKQLYLLLNSYNEVFEEEVNYVRNALVGEYTSLLYSNVQRAKKIAETDTAGNLSAAYELIDNTKKSLSRVAEILGETDPQYVVLADSLSNQILQSGINYFNSSSEEDAPYKAYEIQSYASSVACGKLVKGRCKENLDILNKILKYLPPRDLRDFDKRINNFINTYQSTYSISNQTYAVNRRAYRELDEIETISYGKKILCALENALNGFGVFIYEINQYKCKLNSDEEKKHADLYMADVSTKFASSILSKLIEIVNKSTKFCNENSILRHMPHFVLGETIEPAWNIISMMGTMPMIDEFKENRFLPNRDTLSKIYDDVVTNNPYYNPLIVSVQKTRGKQIDIRSEIQVYNECSKGIKECNYYLSRHPEGQYKQSVLSKIDEFRWAACKTIEDYQNYINDYNKGTLKDGKHILDAKEYVENYDWNNCKTISDYRLYINNYRYGKHLQEAKSIVKQYEERDKAFWNTCTDSKSLKQYLKDFEYGAFRREAQARLKIIKDKNTKLQVIGIIIIVVLLIILFSV